MKNLKKSISLVLALALAMTTMSVIAFADNLTGDATIALTLPAGGTGPEIIDPPGPTDPPITEGFTPSSEYFNDSLNFGTVEASISTVSYPSGNEVGVVIGSFDNWNVKVSVGGFKDSANAAVLQGFTLTLTKEGTVLSDGTTAPTIPTTLDITAADAGPTTIMTGSTGYTAGKWSGSLSVPGGSKKTAGTATAVMTWVIAAII